MLRLLRVINDRALKAGQKCRVDEMCGIGGPGGFPQGRELQVVNRVKRRVFTVQRQLVEGDCLLSSPNIPVRVSSNGRAY